MQSCRRQWHKATAPAAPRLSHSAADCTALNLEAAPGDLCSNVNTNKSGFLLVGSLCLSPRASNAVLAVGGSGQMQLQVAGGCEVPSRVCALSLSGSCQPHPLEQRQVLLRGWWGGCTEVLSWRSQFPMLRVEGRKLSEDWCCNNRCFKDNECHSTQ